MTFLTGMYVCIRMWNCDIEIVPWEGISKSILRGSIDVGITPINARHDELHYDLLFRESHRAYCNSEHRLFGKKIRKINQLSKEKFVLTGDDEPEQLTKFRMKHNLGHHIGGNSSSLEEAKTPNDCRLRNLLSTGGFYGARSQAQSVVALDR